MSALVHQTPYDVGEQEGDQDGTGEGCEVLDTGSLHQPKRQTEQHEPYEETLDQPVEVHRDSGLTSFRWARSELRPTVSPRRVERHPAQRGEEQRLLKVGFILISTNRHVIV